MKRIKENITKEKFTVLINNLKSDTKIRANRKDRLIVIYSLLYYTGLRVNETTQFTANKLLELIKEKTLIVETHKTKTERKLYITDNGQKELKKIFKDLKPSEELLIRSERVTKVLDNQSIILDVNSYLKVIFGKEARITSHSFRQTLITELAEANINTKVIQSFIGHKSSSSTLRYIKPSESNIINSLNGVR